FIFFFFQAEDGIRDGHVTGVQTCALPISDNPPFRGTWPHPKSHEKADYPPDYSKEPSTLVEFRLEKTANGTVLTVTESGFDKLPADRRLEAFRRNEGGWAEQIKNVEAYLAKNS